MLKLSDHSELGEVCLRCYQDEILENGQPRSGFDGEAIGAGPSCLGAPSYRSK